MVRNTAIPILFLVLPLVSYTMSEKKDPMTTTLAWQHNRDMWIRVLEKQTGEGVDAWNSRIRKYRFSDEPQLRTWLSERNVTGYAQQLLVMERFGYPDFVLATAEGTVAR